MKNGQKLKLGDAHITPRNIQEVQASKLGDAPSHPFFIGKNQVTFQHTIFLLLHILCIFLEHLYFCFQFYFVLFSAINGGTPKKFFWRRCTYLSLPRTLYFSLLSFNGCSLFLELRLALVFRLAFAQILFYLCIKVYLDHWSMLVFIERVVPKRFEWCWKREKVSCKKVVQK
jgi:hypothetical protein